MSDSQSLANVLRDAIGPIRTGQFEVFKSRNLGQIAQFIATASEVLDLAADATECGGDEIIGRRLHELSLAAKRWSRNIAEGSKYSYLIHLDAQPDVGRAGSSELDQVVYAAYCELWSSVRDFFDCAGKAWSLTVDLPSTWNEREATALARKLLNAATRLLPPADRARYTAEFCTELTEITAARGSRCAQLAYAARLIVAAPRLRTELKAPRRQSASQ